MDMGESEAIILSDACGTDLLLMDENKGRLAARQMGLDFGIAQPSYMVASGYSEGFALDRYNCAVDYLLTDTPDGTAFAGNGRHISDRLF